MRQKVNYQVQKRVYLDCETAPLKTWISFMYMPHLAHVYSVIVFHVQFSVTQVYMLVFCCVTTALGVFLLATRMYPTFPTLEELDCECYPQNMRICGKSFPFEWSQCFIST